MATYLIANLGFSTRPDQEFLDRLPMAAYGIQAPEGTIAWFNSEAARLWGRRPAIGDPTSDFADTIASTAQMARTWRTSTLRLPTY